jgi:hypothetical protein
MTQAVYVASVSTLELTVVYFRILKPQAPACSQCHHEDAGYISHCRHGNQLRIKYAETLLLSTMSRCSHPASYAVGKERKRPEREGDHSLHLTPIPISIPVRLQGVMINWNKSFAF